MFLRHFHPVIADRRATARTTVTLSHTPSSQKKRFCSLDCVFSESFRAFTLSDRVDSPSGFALLPTPGWASLLAMFRALLAVFASPSQDILSGF